MKRQTPITVCLGVGVLVSAAATATADPFQNLDFEGAIPPLIPSGSHLIPHWGPVGGVDHIGLNEPVNWSNSMILYDKDCALHLPFEGQYGIALFPSPNPTGNVGDPPMVESLAQRANLPADAGLIHFKNWGERVRVFLWEQEISISYSSDNGVGDISAFAGQDVMLRFQTLPATTWPQYSALDSIWFSPIPEPSTTALLSLGAAAVGWAASRRKRL